MSTTTAHATSVSPPWEDDTTTTVGERFPMQTYGGRTVEPTGQERARLLGVILAGDRRPVAWPKLCERTSDTRITSRYMFTLVLSDDVFIEAGDARELVSPSVSFTQMAGVVFTGRQPSQIKPRTALGKRLIELRQRIIASGVPLLDWNDLEKETRSRRGERDS